MALIQISIEWRCLEINMFNNRYKIFKKIFGPFQKVPFYLIMQTENFLK